MSTTHNEHASTTHFGFQTVEKNQKAHKVAEVFHSVASRYDTMNDLMSIGVHRLWKRFAINESGVREGHHVLDIAGGSGDLSQAFAKRVGKTGQVWLTDINASMLGVGRDRMLDAGLTCQTALCDAEALPFPDHSFDCVTVAFGLRNMTHKDIALREMHRVLKVGGRLLVLEFSQPWKPLKPAYDWYSFNILPWLGQKITHDSESYRYLAESIRMHPDQETLQAMMTDAGFARVNYFNLSAGIVALHKGFKL